ncbi:double C2-like domain-containing protein beta [Anneissia japonica]|uniref:double C2-like domain-containing protein beta n=1 Tax=Anneissia japonica TaxID=1529436 RepID=UPI00142579B3|nr:double C2-like domain-containing protein beta [Anneissia japonica]
MGGNTSQVEAGGTADTRDPQKINSDNERVARLARAMTARPNDKRPRNDHPFWEDQEDEDHDGYKESMYILKQLYKRMDPTVMKTLGDAKGEVKLSMKYDWQRKLLLVKVVSARDLSAKDLRGKASDPYIKLDLVPDSHSEGAKSTSVVTRSLSPTYNEILTFKVLEEDLVDTQLRVQVMSHDPMGKDDFMGERIIPVGEMNLSKVCTDWYTLQAETDLDIKGELEIGLQFLLPDTLQVSIFGASQLVCRDPDKLPCPYVKVIIPGVPKVEQTKIVKNTLDPEWNEVFNFPVAEEELSSRYIVLHLLDKAFVGETDALGQIFIDLMNLDINVGYTGKFALADLKNSNKVRTKWSQTATVQEFREAMYAHAVNRYPKLVFQKHKGNKVVTVSSRKAGSSAKIRIIDGMAI